MHLTYNPSLVSGKLIKRYKRFLSDIELENGSIVTAHCPNPGAMTGLKEPGLKVWLQQQTNPKAKLKYRWELVEADDTIVGINTQRPNQIIHQALIGKELEPFKNYDSIKPEVKYGEKSRIDFLLEKKNSSNCYLEIKNVHLKRKTNAEFPDSVTQRGTKHIKELVHMKELGHQAALLFLVQRNDCDTVSIAKDIDPTYHKTLNWAIEEGLDVYAYCCRVTTNGIMLDRQIRFE